MAKPISLKCRSKSGNHLINDFDTESTLGDLKGYILSLTGLEYDRLLLKSGFPPTLIKEDDNLLLKDCGIRNGDLIVVEEMRGSILTNHSKTSPGKRTAPSDSPINEVSAKKPSSENLNIRRYVVPANNSCLFASVNYCISGVADQRHTRNLRQVIADGILSDPKKFTEATLGKSPKDYADWIMRPESWGGGIELSILCDHFQVEIDVIDIQHTRVEKFGEGHNNRILLLYDGIHYDPLHEDSSPKPRTIFPSFNDEVLSKALCLAEVEKANRQFTDARNLKLQCLVCGKGLAGPVEANEHAKETKHINFGER